MPDKYFLRNFEDFKGLNYRTTPLKDDVFYCDTATNYEKGEGDFLIGIKGFQLSACATGFTSVHTYHYVDTTTNTVNQEIIGINDNLWKLVATNLTVVRVAGSATWEFSNALNSSTNVFDLTLTQGGVPLTVPSGTGLEDLPLTILDLRDGIDALANFTCAVPTRTARVNGLQNNVNAIVVDAGHTFAVGDEMFLWDYSTNKLVSKTLTATAAALLTFDAAYGTVSVKDNQVLGIGSIPAASIATGIDYSGTATDPNLNLPFYYWEKIPNSTDAFNRAGDEPFEGFWAAKDSTNWQHANFVSANNTTYIFTNYGSQTPLLHEGYPHKYDGQRVYRSGVPKYYAKEPNPTVGGAGLTGIYKYIFTYVQYDKRGNRIEGTRLPDDFIVATTAANQTITQNIRQAQAAVYYTESLTGLTINNGVAEIAAAAGPAVVFTIKTPHNISTGDYIYFQDTTAGVLRWQTRLVTNIVYNGATYTVTIAGANVTVAANAKVYKSPNHGFNYGCAIVDTTQANVNTIVVEHNSLVGAAPDYLAFNTLKVGDVVYFLDRGTGSYVTRNVTAINTTKTQITIDGRPVNVTDNDVISANLRIAIYRTKTGGNLYYLREEIPNNAFLDIVSYADALSDTLLGGQYIDPPIGKEPDPPPRATIGCLHQGLMMYSRIIGNPNAVAYSDVVSLEAVPSDPDVGNNFIVPPNITGEITAIASDTEDRLAVFKANAYYDCVGDFTQSNFIVKNVKEGDYGISSQTSISRVDGILIGVGKLGIIGIYNGQLVKDIGYYIDPAILNSSDIILSKAIAFNDYTARKFHIYIPGESSFGIDETLQQLFFSFDYEGKLWTDKSYSSGLNPEGGFLIFNESPYHFSRNFGGSVACANSGHLFKQLDSQVSPRAYAQNHLAITNTFTTKDLSIGDPSLLKNWTRFAVWAFNPRYSPREDFTLTVTSYRNFQTATGSSSFTMSFASTDYKKSVPLIGVKAEAMKFKLVSNTLFKAPMIGGLEICIPAPQTKEDLKNIDR